MVKRYDCVAVDGGLAYFVEAMEYPDGQWVRYEDFVAAVERVSRYCDSIIRGNGTVNETIVASTVISLLKRK